LDRREEILAKHADSVARADARRANRPVWEVLADALDEDDDSDQCTVCAL